MLCAVKVTAWPPVSPVSMMSACPGGVKIRSKASALPAAEGSVSAPPVVSCLASVPSGVVLQMFWSEFLTKAIRPFVPNEGKAPPSLIFVWANLGEPGLRTYSFVGGKQSSQPVGPRLYAIRLTPGVCDQLGSLSCSALFVICTGVPPADGIL